MLRLFTARKYEEHKRVVQATIAFRLPGPVGWHGQSAECLLELTGWWARPRRAGRNETAATGQDRVASILPALQA